jgi:hypothetical protein
MNPLQKAAVRRKSFYFAAILALFTISIFYRGLEAKTPDGPSYVWLPFGRDDREGAASAVSRSGDAAARSTILSQARRLELRELDEGDPEIAGEAVRLGLVGSRGFAVTFLWYAAIEKQKRNDFHEFERLVKAVTTLQPHFITPWIFQSWNIAYNVSVEMQSLGDMYFYIARGIDLLAEGERRNRRSPDMRYQIAFYYQNKFGVSDQVQTLRCLFQLSCIPPDARDPDALENPDGTVNMEAFRKFCQDHPMLVRRLRGEERQDRERQSQSAGESLRTRRPEDVVQFLRDNKNVPSRYRNATELKVPEQQFPVLPPPFPEGEAEAQPRSSAEDLTEAFSGYLAARAWFAYATTIVPPNPTDKEGNPMPSTAPEEFDQFKYRLPRMPVLILFRQGPPRAQTYQAEMMQKDGWFDGEGWEVDAGIDESNAWFVESVGGVKRKPATPVVVGAGTPWSILDWQKSFTRWANHGTNYGLLLRPNQLEQLRKDANVPPGTEYVPPPPPATREQLENEAFARRHQAQEALFYYSSNRNLTNFPFYYALSEGEQQKETVEARKTFWKADQERRRGNNLRAMDLYRRGMEQWRNVLIKNPNFHRSERLTRIEEDTIEYQLDYLRLIAAHDSRVWKKAVEDYANAYQEKAKAAAAAIPFGVPGPAPKEIPLAIRDAKYAEAAEKHFAPFAGNITVQDVPPGDPRIGTPWYTDNVRDLILQREGIAAPPSGPPTGPPVGPAPLPPPPGSN